MNLHQGLSLLELNLAHRSVEQWKRGEVSSWAMPMSARVPYVSQLRHEQCPGAAMEQPIDKLVHKLRGASTNKTSTSKQSKYLI